MQQLQAEPVTVEAGSAEQALEEITNRLGPDAEILEAQKVHKGGIGGFFARELVQITARTRGSGDAPAVEADPGDLFDAPFQRVLAAALSNEPEFEIGLTEPDLSDGDDAVPTSTPAAPPMQAVAADWRLSGGADWSVTALARCDLPTSITQAVMDLDPRDDLGWVAAIAGAVAPLCRPLPGGDGVLAGPGAGRLGTALDTPVVEVSEIAPYRGTFAAAVTPTDADREWLEMVRGDRWLHLVVGDGDSMALLDDNVLAVSWSSDEAVASALRLASSLGLVLGYGMSSNLGAPAYRATPIDVALAVRNLMGRR